MYELFCNIFVNLFISLLSISSFWQSASLVIHDYLCYNSIEILLQIVYVIACSIYLEMIMF